MVEFVHNSFEIVSFPEEFNEMLISLVPKQDYSERMSQFRPIALCNVMVKVITKIIANRVKPLMGKLTGEQQASFIPNRRGVDNMIIDKKNHYSMRRKTAKKDAWQSR